MIKNRIFEIKTGPNIDIMINVGFVCLVAIEKQKKKIAVTKAVNKSYP